MHWYTTIISVVYSSSLNSLTPHHDYNPHHTWQNVGITWCIRNRLFRSLRPLYASDKVPHHSVQNLLFYRWSQCLYLSGVWKVWTYLKVFKKNCSRSYFHHFVCVHLNLTPRLLFPGRTVWHYSYLYKEQNPRSLAGCWIMQTTNYFTWGQRLLVLKWYKNESGSKLAF